MTESKIESKNTRYLRRKRERLEKEFGSVCKICGKSPEEDEKFHFAHKVGFRLSFGESRGMQNRLLAVERNPEQFFLSCEICHRKYDKENPPTDYEKEISEKLENEKVPF